MSPRSSPSIAGTWASRTSSSCRSPSTRSSRRGATRRPGYFAATSRYGTPQDLMFLIDTLHQAGIGVILDWVPSHFATDDWALAKFDGTRLYEHSDSRAGLPPGLGQLRLQLQPARGAELLALVSALFWLDKYHIDGLRVDAVASMLYLDYSRKDGEWIPNQYRRQGEHRRDRASCAASTRRSTGTSRTCRQSPRNPRRGRWCRGRPTSAASASATSGTWAGCTTRCRYFADDPIHRKYHQNDLTFRMLYAYNENFVLPLSHDEVVHGKGPLWDKMAGDEWQKYAGLRAALRLPVGHDRQEAAVHGRRDRPAAGVAARSEHRLAPAASMPRTRACSRWSAT